MESFIFYVYVWDFVKLITYKIIIQKMSHIQTVHTHTQMHTNFKTLKKYFLRRYYSIRISSTALIVMLHYNFTHFIYLYSN